MITAIETTYQDYRFRSRTEARWAVFFDALGLTWRYEVEGFDLGAAGWYLPDFWLPDLQLWCEIKGTEPGDAELRKLQALAEGQGCNVLLLIGEPGPATYVRNPLYHDLPEIHWSYEGRLFVGDYSPAEQAAEYSCMPRSRIESLAEFLQDKAAAGAIAGPVPAFNGTQAALQQLLDLDRQYYRQRYGKEHPHWRWGYVIDGLRWCERAPRQWALSCAMNEFAEHATPALLDAYRAARSARFEHGEQPITARRSEPAPPVTPHDTKTERERGLQRLLTDLAAHDVHLARVGDRLHIPLRLEPLPMDLRATLEDYKAEILPSLPLALHPRATCTLAEMCTTFALDGVQVLDGKIVSCQLLPAENQGTMLRAQLWDVSGYTHLVVSRAVYEATSKLWSPPGQRLLLSGRMIQQLDDSYGTHIINDGYYDQHWKTSLEVLDAQPVELPAPEHNPTANYPTSPAARLRPAPDLPAFTISELIEMLARPADGANPRTSELLSELHERQVALIDLGATLRCEAPLRVLSADLRAILDANKDPILYALRRAANPQPTHTIKELRDTVLLDDVVGVIAGRLNMVKTLPTEEEGTRVHAKLGDQTGVACLKVPEAVFRATAPMWTAGPRLLITGHMVYHKGHLGGVWVKGADSWIWRSHHTMLEVLDVHQWHLAVHQVDLEVMDAAE